jgi:hypothetical protein
LIIGFDRNGKLIEVFYNILDADTVRVFHAMIGRCGIPRLYNSFFYNKNEVLEMPKNF